MKALSGFLDRPSSYSHQLVSEQGCRVGKRSKESRKSGINSHSYVLVRSNLENQVLCHFFQFSRIQVRIQSYTFIIRSFFVNYSFVIKKYALYLVVVWIWLWNANFWNSDFRMNECASLWFLKILFWVIIRIKFGRLNQLNSILECPECILIEIWWQLRFKHSNQSLRWEYWYMRFWFL